VLGVPEPSYQLAANINDQFGTLAKSDVSAVADPFTGVWVFISGQGWLVVGGTSVSCPLWAGFMALVNQIRASHRHFAPAGFINPFLYSTVYGPNGNSAVYANDFHDVKTGSNGWAAGTGWDVPTGLGSFRAFNLAQTLGTNATA